MKEMFVMMTALVAAHPSSVCLIETMPSMMIVVESWREMRIVSRSVHFVKQSKLVMTGLIVRDRLTCNVESNMAHRVSPGHSGGKSLGSSPWLYMEQCGNASAPKSGVYGVVVVVVVVVIVIVVSSRCREWYLECSRRNTVTAGRIFFHGVGE